MGIETTEGFAVMGDEQLIKIEGGGWIAVPSPWQKLWWAITRPGVFWH